ncbi:MAG: sensor histidine kinase [Bdellovibrionota bacterium]
MVGIGIHRQVEMILIYFIYGCSFLLFGSAILFQVRYDLQKLLGTALPALGLFGVLHGLSEWLVMLSLVPEVVGKIPGIYIAIFFANISSFLFLAHFGFSSLSEVGVLPAGRATRFAAPLLLSLSMATAVVFYHIKGLTMSWDDLIPPARFFLVAPGACATGTAILQFRRKPSYAQVTTWSLDMFAYALAGTFFLYAVVAGVVTEPSPIFPASIINSQVFLEAFGIRIQVLRSICAVGATFFMAKVLSVVFRGMYAHLEMQIQLKSEELTRQQQLVFTAAKMSTLGEMAGGIAHEINNPLSIIKIKSEQLKDALSEECLDKALLVDMADKIIKVTGRIAEIINGLRSFSRDGAADPMKSIELAAIIEETLVFCRERFRSNGISLEVLAPGGALKIECRPTQISQILLNLANNSFDAVQDLKEKWIKVEVIDRGENVEVILMDSGRGVPLSIREKMMQPFFTTKQIGKGTGLGLSISFGIAQSHGGKLSYDDKCPNTRFVLRLPKLQKKEAGQAA